MKEDTVNELLKIGMNEPSVNAIIKNCAIRRNSNIEYVLSNCLEEIMLEIIKIEIKFKHEYEDMVKQLIQSSTKPITFK